jgi:hypothetical protein
MVRNGRMALAAAAAVVLLGGCPAKEESGCEPDLQADLTLPALTIAAQGGFDDFGAGAAQGYAVDTTNGVTVVAAMKFQLPGASYSFAPSCDAESAARAFTVVSAGAPSGVDVATWPILEAALANTSGIRALTASSSGGILILLEGDPTQATPTRILVADSGDFTLFRDDGPADRVEAHGVRFREVDRLGTGALLSGGRVVQIDALFFGWPTPGIP